MTNWLYNSLLKQWCDDNRIIYMEERDMAKTMEREVGRIYEELTKWCTERGVIFDIEVFPNLLMICWKEHEKEDKEKAKEELKAERHDDAVDVTRYLVVLGKKKRAEEMIRSLKSQIEAITIAKDKALDKDAELIKSLENDIRRLECNNNDLDNNVKDMFATVRSLKKENVGLKDANNFLNIKLEKRDEVIEALKVSNDELRAKIENLLEENYNLDNHVKNLVAQVETLDREKNKTLIDSFIWD